MGTIPRFRRLQFRWAETTGEETLIAAAARHMSAVPPSEMAKHVGILVALDRIVHAYDAAGKVAEGHLASAWRARIASVFAFPPLGEQKFVL